jgi:BirA family biotin operon repressor/biotin-[acetyl-CoA-carboxylase] ligase
LSELPKTALLPLLADGQYHSCQALAEALGVSRTTVWKQLSKLQTLDLTIESVKGRGYRIVGGIDLLDAAAVRAGLGSDASALLSSLTVLPSVDSTNAEALRAPVTGGGHVYAAEQQTAGRGRRGRLWASPFARNIYVSLVWEFDQGAAALEGLSLAVGVAVARALAAVGAPTVQLKWPNDVLYQGAKLGGVLLEMVGDAAGSCRVVIGVGLNVAMPAQRAAGIDQSWTDLKNIMDTAVPSRSVLLAALLNELLPLAAGFEASGFGPWRDEWQQLDACSGQAVVLTGPGTRKTGIARGADHRGALLLETSVGLQTVYGGEISLRVSS